MTTYALVPAHLTRRCALCGLWLAAAAPLTMLLLFVGQWLLGPVTEELSTRIGMGLGLVAHGAAGALWGRSLARVTGHGEPLRWMAAGAVGFGVVSTLAIAALNTLEQNLVWFLVRNYETHMVFGVAFALAALVIAGSTGLILGLALGHRRPALQLALGAGLSAALTFTLVAVVMDLAGMRVGGPGAADRATMIVVSLLGMWSAGIVGTVVIGLIVTRFQGQRPPFSVLTDSPA